MDKEPQTEAVKDAGHEGQASQAGSSDGVRSAALTTRLASLPAAQLSAVLDNAIEDYGRGKSVYAIALGLGVEHTTLYRQLIKHREAEWRDAKVSRALAELEESEDDLKTAPDALALTRARERCRAAQWQLERLMRRIYGQDVPQSSQVVQINISLRRNADAAIVDIEEVKTEERPTSG